MKEAWAMPQSSERRVRRATLGTMLLVAVGFGGCMSSDTGYTGVPGSDAASCMASPPDAGAASWHPPRSPSSACTPRELEAYYGACFSPGATKASCAPFESDPVRAACVACVITNADAAALGPMLRWPNQAVQPDIAGCLALADGDSSASGCGASYFAQQQCEYTACASCSDQRQFDACAAAAQAGACAPLVQAAACAGAAKYDPCFFIGFSQYFYGLGLRFCAAGADSGADASSD
jgi:hypothetical protein